LHVAISTPHAFLGLRDHLLDQREKVPQLADLCFYPQELALCSAKNPYTANL
jgi:hypothetical protein